MKRENLDCMKKLNGLAKSGVLARAPEDDILPCSFSKNTPLALYTSNYDNDNHSYYDVYILNCISGSPRHSLDTYIRLEGEIRLPKQSFVPPDLTSSIRTHHITSRAKAAHNRQRSLTDAAPATAIYDEMSTFANEAPGSPPGLTASKSSKSSTNRSSSISGADGILSDNADFEDIGLNEEEYQPFQPKPMNGVETLKGLQSRTAETASNGHRSNSGAMTTMRDLTNEGHTPAYPRPSEPYKGRETSAPSLTLPYGGQMRKGVRNASTPSLAIRAMSNHSRSRSPSPQSPSFPLSKPLPCPKSPRRPNGAQATTQQLPIRRGSWQPSRRSVKELEAEYNEADEDLPEDASLWNVPLSPRPPSERCTPISVNTSPRASPCASPERPSPLRTSIGLDGTEVMAPRTVPIIAARRTLPPTLPSPPNSPRKLLRGVSTGAIPELHAYPRSKSWNVALSELSEEAKDLTAALEDYGVAAEAKHESAVQNGEATSLKKPTRAKTSSSIELPPLKANNIMIDPLPISKEKEKVLSRTRPSWLPPKSQKEEKRHLKEYQRMMEFSMEAERRKAAKKADHQCAKDDTKSALLRIWEEHVLPNWDQVIREPRTRELWWRGISPRSRAQVWQRAIGNDLALTEVTYEKALQRAKTIEAEIARDRGGEHHRKEKAWFYAIYRDVKHTFPELNIFQSGAPFHDGLVEVLMAYSMYRSDIGYCHGTHLIAAFFSLTMATPCQTFLALSNLLNRPLPLAFLTGDLAGTRKAYDLTLSLLRKKYPRLHSHLFSSRSATVSPSPTNDTATMTDLSSQPLNLPPSSVLEPMMRTLFLGPGNGLGIDIAARVWDVMVFDGDAAVIRTAVAVLGALEGKLYGSKEEVLGVLSWRGNIGQALGDEEAFITRVRKVGKER